MMWSNPKTPVGGLPTGLLLIAIALFWDRPVADIRPIWRDFASAVGRRFWLAGRQWH